MTSSIARTEIDWQRFGLCASKPATSGYDFCCHQHRNHSGVRLADSEWKTTTKTQLSVVTIRYDSGYLTCSYIMGDQRMMSFGFFGSPPPFLANKIWWWWWCSKKLTGSQLSLPHGTNKKLKCETKNKMMSIIGPVQSRYREAVQ